jgi:hypothetical protein
MDDLLNRLINQLNTLIPFIGISQEDVFQLIQREKQVWFPNNEDSFPDNYDIYKTQINHSAFLLGYSYFEAFLSDLAKFIFLSQPSMLSMNKELKFKEIIKVNNYDEVKIIMINKVLLEHFNNSVEDVMDNLFNKKLQLKCSDDFKENFIRASRLRNCIMHNMGIVDYRLAEVSDYREGDTIKLTSSQVHSFGNYARNDARNLWKQVIDKHMKNV